jgi:hypothetical protein
MSLFNNIFGIEKDSASSFMHRFNCPMPRAFSSGQFVLDRCGRDNQINGARQDQVVNEIGLVAKMGALFVAAAVAALLPRCGCCCRFAGDAVATMLLHSFTDNRSTRAGRTVVCAVTCAARDPVRM